MEKKNKQTNKQKNKTKQKQKNKTKTKKKKTLPTSWLFKVGRSFLSAAKHGRQIQKQLTMLRRYACHILRLIGFDCYGKP